MIIIFFEHNSLLLFAFNTRKHATYPWRSPRPTLAWQHWSQAVDRVCSFTGEYRQHHMFSPHFCMHALKGLACYAHAVPASSHASPCSCHLCATFVAAPVLFTHTFVDVIQRKHAVFAVRTPERLLNTCDTCVIVLQCGCDVVLLGPTCEASSSPPCPVSKGMCGHRFHKHCILEWLSTCDIGESDMLCPFGKQLLRTLTAVCHVGVDVSIHMIIIAHGT